MLFIVGTIRGLVGYKDEASVTTRGLAPLLGVVSLKRDATRKLFLQDGMGRILISQKYPGICEEQWLVLVSTSGTSAGTAELLKVDHQCLSLFPCFIYQIDTLQIPLSFKGSAPKVFWRTPQNATTLHIRV